MSSANTAASASRLRVLDLGCGEGLTPQKLNLPPDWEIIGIDLQHQSLEIAQQNFPGRTFIRARGERLPFADGYFDLVISNVALPYMNIPKTLAETRRVLSDAGAVMFSLHSFRFSWNELRRAFPRPEALLHRCSVLANGFWFHLSGRNLGECFQTERGTRIALRRAAFGEILFRHDSQRWIVEARVSPAASSKRTQAWRREKPPRE